MQTSKVLSITLLTILLLGPFGSANGQADDGGNLQFIGVWNAVAFVPRMGRMASQIILRADGTYIKQDRGLDTGSLTTISGNFQVFPDRRLLRLNIQHAEPTKTCGPLGCNPIRYPAGESYTYSFTDANSLQLHFNYCAPNQCTYTYKRAS